MTGRAKERRTLVLGLDVGDGPLLERFAAEGRLPAVARLLADGVHGSLATTAELLHVCAWPSLYTGELPGAHGVYYTFQPRPGVQGAVRFADDQYGAAPFWAELDAAGRDVIVFDAPYTHPWPGMRGLQIFEWGTWAHYRKPAVRPAARSRELRALLGRHPLGPRGLEAGKVGMRGLDPGELAPALCEAVLAKGAALRRLLERVPWDCAFAVFGETHAAAHYLWPRGAHDMQAASGDPARLAPLAAVYEAFDAVLGELLERYDEDVDLLVVSGDGAGANHGGWHLLPQALERAGFARGPGGPLPPVAAERAAAPAPPPSRGLFARLRDALPQDLRQRVSGLLPDALSDALMRRKAAEALDWSRTRAFALPTDLEGCVRLNLRGREPFGIVERGDEERALAAELAATLRSLVEPSSGRSAVERVLLAEDLGEGPRRDRLPDLVVRWSDAAPLEALALPGGPTLARGPSPDPRPGTHRPHGFLAARGRGLARGARFFGAHVVDFAPTLLERSGLPRPAHAAGRVLKELS